MAHATRLDDGGVLECLDAAAARRQSGQPVFATYRAVAEGRPLWGTYKTPEARAAFRAKMLNTRESGAFSGPSG